MANGSHLKNGFSVVGEDHADAGENMHLFFKYIRLEGEQGVLTTIDLVETVSSLGIDLHPEASVLQVSIEEPLAVSRIRAELPSVQG